MSDLKTFLLVLKKFGYPNSDLVSLSNLSGYDLDNFLPDLVEELGESKASKFALKALNKFYDKKKGIRVGFDDAKEYAYIKLYNPHLDLDNDETSIMCDWSFGDTHLFYVDMNGKESYKTFQEIEAEAGMGEWNELDEYADTIKEDCSRLVFNNCGFFIWWEDYTPEK